MSISTEEFIKRHSADLQQAGFDNQFASFVLWLLKLKSGDRITYEREDDFVVYKKNGVKYLVQVKYSTDHDARMTNADSDFWKTIDNWLCFYETLSEDEKKEFISQKHRLIIYTNKIISNEFWNKIEGLRNGAIELKEVLAYLKSVSKDNSYYGVVKKLKVLDKNELRQFLMKVGVDETLNPLADIYDFFLLYYNNPPKADLILVELLGSLLKEKITAAKTHVKLSFLKDDFLQNYKGILNKVGDETLSMAFNEKPQMPKNIDKIMMVRQMRSVGVIDVKDNTDPDLITHYGNWLNFLNSRDYFYANLQLNPKLEADIDVKAIEKWKMSSAKHRTMVRLGQENVVVGGANCFFEMMEQEFSVGQSTLRTPFSSGWYLNLSNLDDPLIYWHKDWKQIMDKE